MRTLHRGGKLPTAPGHQDDDGGGQGRGKLNFGAAHECRGLGVQGFVRRRRTKLIWPDLQQQPPPCSTPQQLQEGKPAALGAEPHCRRGASRCSEQASDHHQNGEPPLKKRIFPSSKPQSAVRPSDQIQAEHSVSPLQRRRYLRHNFNQALPSTLQTMSP